MARQKSIQTATGMVIVRQGTNARSEFTGRVGGVTYTGATWAAVEAKIQEAYAVQYEWSRWLVFTVRHDRYDNWERERDIDVAFQWEEVQVSQRVSKPGFDPPHRTVDGYMVLEGEEVARFHKGETVRQALGKPCLPWTEGREAFARDVVARLRATAEGIDRFLRNEDLERAVDASPSARALTGGSDAR